MGFFGKLLAAPVRLVNAPIRALERIVEADGQGEVPPVFSRPLEKLAEEIERIDGDKEDDHG